MTAAARSGTPHPPTTTRRRPAGRGTLEGVLRANEPVVLGFIGVAVTVGLWQAIASSGLISPLLFPSPGATATAFVNLFATGEVYPHIAASLWLLVTGLTTAVVSGTIVGFAAGWFPTLRALLLPHITLLYATPSIALMPLFIVFMGLGFASQFGVVVMLAFFPAYYAAVDAVRTADASLLRVGRSFTASDPKLFWSVILPGSVPLLISGLRIALGKAIIAVVLVELYASAVGVGYLLNISGIRFKTATVFAVIGLLAITGLIASFALRWLEQRFDKWRPHTAADEA